MSTVSRDLYFAYYSALAEKAQLAQPGGRQAAFLAESAITAFVSAIILAFVKSIVGPAADRLIKSYQSRSGDRWSEDPARLIDFLEAISGDLRAAHYKEPTGAFYRTLREHEISPAESKVIASQLLEISEEILRASEGPHNE